MNEKENKQEIDQNLVRKGNLVQNQEKINDHIEEERREQVNFANQEIGEDVTQYGEFVSTYFAWVPPTKQKQRANELEEMTKPQNKEEKTDKK